MYDLQGDVSILSEMGIVKDYVDTLKSIKRLLILPVKVQMFWEGHKIWRNLHLSFYGWTLKRFKFISAGKAVILFVSTNSYPTFMMQKMLIFNVRKYVERSWFRVSILKFYKVEGSIISPAYVWPLRLMRSFFRESSCYLVD